MRPALLLALGGLLWPSATVQTRLVQPAATELVAGRSLDAALGPGAADAYRLSLARGDFFRITIQQRGIDIVATFVDPNGRDMLTVDAMDDEFRPETVAAIGESAGMHTIVIQASSGAQFAGRYVIQLDVVRPADAADEKSVAAERGFTRGRQIRDPAKAPTWPEALAEFTGALERYRQLADRRGEMKTLIEIGITQYYLSRSEEALTAAEEAARIAREIDDGAALARALKSRGNTLVFRGDLSAAVVALDESVAVSRAIGHRNAEARSLNDAAIAYRRLGAIEQAMTRYETALPLARVTRDAVMESNILNNLGVVYLYMGENARAREMYQQSLANRRAANDLRGQTFALQNLGVLHRRLGDYETARQFHMEAADIARRTGDQTREAEAVNALGTVYVATGAFDKALELHRASLAIRRQIGDRSGQALAELSVAVALHGLGRDEEAVPAFQSALETARSINARFIERDVLGDLASFERDRGNLIAARQYVEQSITLDEALRRSVTSPELRASFVALEHDRYQLFIDILQRQHAADPDRGHVAEALQVSERARARVLLESMLDPRVDVRRGIDATLLDRERALQKQINDTSAQLSRALAKNPADRNAETAQRLERLTSEYQQLQAEIRRSSPRYADLVQPQTLTLAEIREQVLDEESVLLEFALGDERGWLWAVTPSHIVTAPLPPRREIDGAVRALYERLTARQRRPGENSADYVRRIAAADAGYSAEASRVSAMILGGIAEQLARDWRGKRLVIVADSALEYLPFGALPLPSVANGERGTTPALVAFSHEIVTIPSASVLAAARRDGDGSGLRSPTVAILADPVFERADPRVAAASPQRTASGAADPARVADQSDPRPRAGFSRLPFSRDEAEAIAKLAPRGGAFKAIDFKANRETVLGDALSGYGIIHFATHGLVDSERPALSSLVLSLVNETGAAQNGYLRLADIYNMRLDAGLVVLSACQTALGKEIRGEGLMGLARAFMYAGAPRVVASLWEVSDVATAELMTRFYRAMLQQHLRPAAALRTAQLEMARDPRWKSPYYWAGFVLQGDWR